MGARPEDYAKVAPYHSYIHVDEFESPRHLAEYLHKLDKNDELYNSYFRYVVAGMNGYVALTTFMKLAAVDTQQVDNRYSSTIWPYYHRKCS